MLDIQAVNALIEKADRQKKEILLKLKNLRASSTEDPSQYPADLIDLQGLRIACIMDAFTFHCYNDECTLLNLTPENCIAEVDEFKPDLLFVESAWKGKDGLWEQKIYQNNDELVALLLHCNQRKIPTVFWNKEDPVHFYTFLEVSKRFDHVFTTDIDHIKHYKNALMHDRVYLLHFAAQTSTHNPVEKYDRKDSFCFAGSYYAKYPERQVDFNNFVDVLSRDGRLEIYDRNYNSGNFSYAFPKEQQRFIKGTLAPHEIDKAYKGYLYGINMNTVKDSQTMFARRVFELLASNTVTVSNYSRGLRNMLGDLVVCTDSKMRLAEEISKLNDPVINRKYRLLGLRKALGQHTYFDRLAYIARKVLNREARSNLPRVHAVAFVTGDGMLKRAVEQFSRQTYGMKSLTLITSDITQPVNDGAIRCVDAAGAAKEKVEDILRGDFVAYLHGEDYYGANYLTDMALTARYTSADAVGKPDPWRAADGALLPPEFGHAYKPAASLPWRSAMVSARAVRSMTMEDLRASIDSGRFEGLCFAIDEFNYTMGHRGDSCPEADDLLLGNCGIDMADLNRIAEEIPMTGDIHDIHKTLPLDELIQSYKADPRLTVSMAGEDIAIGSSLPDRAQTWVNFLKVFDKAEFLQDGKLKLQIKAIATMELQVAVTLLNAKQKEVATAFHRINESIVMEVPPDAPGLQLGFCVKGPGTARIKSIEFENVIRDNGCVVSRSRVLLVANNYPSYEDLYKNAFVHQRVMAYKRENLAVDVLQFVANQQETYYEFFGVDVIKGNKDTLHELMTCGRYDTVLVHVMNTGIWNVLKAYQNVRLLIWLHGAEIQPWWRREFNHGDEQEKAVEVQRSNQRMKLWAEIFEASREPGKQLEFVFVSRYFADEVMEDHKVRLDKSSYHVIHNIIDTDLFSYEAKDAEQRKKILSIRPFANRKYANDLSVKAILELSRKPFFSELEFRIIGDGALFDSTVAPLRKLKNVILERRFLTQHEIAALHKQYGVFLVPTRMDAQGVSRDEAMSSGLVPVTNAVTAIPEFVDDDSGLLAQGEDYLGLAGAIERLYHDPALFSRLSANATQRVRAQSGYRQTILREMELIGNGKTD